MSDRKREGESVYEQLDRLKIPKTVYFARRKEGLDHDGAIASALERARRSPRYGNAIDWSMSGTNELLRKWRR